MYRDGVGVATGLVLMLPVFSQLETLLRRFPDLFDAALQLTPYAWGHVREGTHADNAMGYIRRVAEQCPQDIYSEFLAAIRGAVTGIPVEDVC